MSLIEKTFYVEIYGIKEKIIMTHKDHSNNSRWNMRRTIWLSRRYAVIINIDIVVRYFRSYIGIVVITFRSHSDSVTPY